MHIIGASSIIDEDDDGMKRFYDDYQATWFDEYENKWFIKE